MPYKTLPYSKRNIVNQKDYSDVYGLLGKAVLPKGELTCVYAAHEFAVHTKLNVSVVNAGSDVTVVEVYVTDQKEPTQVDLVSWGVTLKPGDNYIRSGLILNKEESVWLKCTEDDTVVRIDGFEDRAY